MVHSQKSLILASAFLLCLQSDIVCFADEIETVTEITTDEYLDVEKVAEFVGNEAFNKSYGKITSTLSAGTTALLTQYTSLDAETIIMLSMLEKEGLDMAKDIARADFTTTYSETNFIQLLEGAYTCIGHALIDEIYCYPISSTVCYNYYKIEGADNLNQYYSPNRELTYSYFYAIPPQNVRDNLEYYLYGSEISGISERIYFNMGLYSSGTNIDKRVFSFDNFGQGGYTSTNTLETITFYGSNYTLTNNSSDSISYGYSNAKKAYNITYSSLKVYLVGGIDWSKIADDMTEPDDFYQAFQGWIDDSPYFSEPVKKYMKGVNEFNGVSLPEYILNYGSLPDIYDFDINDLDSGYNYLNQEISIDDINNHDSVDSIPIILLGSFSDITTSFFGYQWVFIFCLAMSLLLFFISR